MKRRPMPRLRRVAAAAAVLTGVLLASSPALGAAIPGGLASNPASPSNKPGEWNFSWGAAGAAVPGETVTYEGGFVTNPGDDPAAPSDAGEANNINLAPPEGTSYFRVRSIEGGLLTSDYSAALTVTADRTGPVVGGIDLIGTPGTGDWYKALTIHPTGCSDAVVGVNCTDQAWTTEGHFDTGTQSIIVKDLLTNPTTVAIPFAFGFDKTKPVSGIPVSPGTLIAAEAPFEWSPGSDALSHVDHYEVAITPTENFGDEYPNGGEVIAKKDDTGGLGNYTASRNPALRPTPLPINVPLKWWIRTVDKAGNLRVSSVVRDLTIDPTVPPAPTITGGPSAPTSDNAPTFSWTGDQTTFRWDVTLVGAQNPARQGGGKNVTQTTLAALPDGDYTFRVTQVTDAGQGSAEATRSFKIDTTPPAPPTILTRPTFPAIGAAPVFTWAGEPGAYSRWSVLDTAGTVIYGPIDTPVTGAELPPLAGGPYVFQVVQIDAAGNVSTATTEGFTVLAPLVAPPGPSSDARTALLSALPKQNALRLQPKAGTTLPTLSPVLRWKKGPRGTKLYNLQIFQVTPRKGGAKPKVSKILSRFPHGLQFRPPGKSLKADTCYVWRVWPYTGTAFTTRPVGVSNFCIAGKKVLRSKAAKAAANHRAK